jgi:myo-inositol-1(or 4)-monophosphatase
MDFSELSQHAITAALQSGALLKKGFGSSFTWFFKEGDHNLVTEYDKQSEDQIVGLLSAKYPSHGFLLEESGRLHVSKEEILWIVDPLDGTVNFAHSIPFFSVSIAALAPSGELLTGVVFNPMTNELFVAEKNKGAYLNQKQIFVTQTQLLDKSFLATGFPYNVKENPLCCIEHFSKFAKMGVPIRRLGSAALDLCYTACGRFDGFFEVSLQPWDFCAGALMIQEAKGRITNYHNAPLAYQEPSPVVASNAHIHSALVNVLEKVNI